MTETTCSAWQSYFILMYRFNIKDTLRTKWFILKHKECHSYAHQDQMLNQKLKSTTWDIKYFHFYTKLNHVNFWVRKKVQMNISRHIVRGNERFCDGKQDWVNIRDIKLEKMGYGLWICQLLLNNFHVDQKTLANLNNRHIKSKQ